MMDETQKLMIDGSFHKKRQGFFLVSGTNSKMYPPEYFDLLKAVGKIKHIPINAGLMVIYHGRK